LAINYTPTTDLPAIEADHAKMIQVIHNLLDNAFNYTRDGGTIDITIQSETDDHILLTIKDSGVGIPEDFYEKIWQRFERHEDTVLTLEVAGTGLGLPIVKEMVEIHSGKVWFESTVDLGTTFFVRLPLKQPEYMIRAGKASSN
jgi:signal transduction histidine kinase